MADNTQLNSGTGGDIIASDEIAGVKHQRVKIQHGADGSATDVSTTSPLPIQGPAADNAPVSGNPVLVGGRYDASIARVLGDGDVGALALDVNGHLITSPHADGAALADGESNTQFIPDNHEGGTIFTPSIVYQFNGTTWDRLRGNATNGLKMYSGVAAGDLGKAIDSPVGATDTGVAMLAVRDDEQAAMTPADGDYSTLRTDKFGNLKVTQLPDATSVVKFGVIDAATSGNNTLQAAAGAGIKIRVLSVMMISAGTVTARFESGAGGTALTGQMNLIANSGFTLPYNPAGWFETADNALLNLELSAAISVDGCFSYVEV